MKRFTRLLLWGLCMCVGVVASAQTFEVDGITYNVLDNTSVAVAKSAGKAYEGSVDIPTAITYQGREYNVTKIATFAFANSTGLTSVTMGNNITAIEEAAFQGCTSLQSAKVSNRTLYLGRNAFADCQSLTTVTLGNYLEDIREDAFLRCVMLGQIELPKTLKKIGNEAFGQCSTLSSIVIPDNVESIGNKAFAVCEALSSVTFGAGVAAVGEQCFQQCTDLKYIVLPQLLSTIEFGTFAYCSKLSSVTFGTNVTTISDKAFLGCESLEKLEIPSTVLEIGEEAFGDCHSVNNLIFADSYSELRYGSGNFTTSPIERLTLGRTLRYTSNNPGAFAEVGREKCSLKRVDITSTVSSLPKAIFKGCKALTTVNIDEGLMEIGQNAFESCEGIVSIRLPESVSRILANGFAKCFNMADINLPSAVSVIETQTFYMCRNISAMDLSNITEIKSGGFSECDRLADVKLSSKLTSIGGDAFNTCIALKSILIPENVKSLGAGAFFESALTDINSLAAVPPTAYDDTWSNEIYARASVTVPASSYDAYASATGWKNFTNFQKVNIFKVTLEANEGGSVLFNGAAVTSLDIKENEALSISIQPNYDKIVESASYTMGGTTTQFSSEVTIPAVTADVTVKVTFADKPATPPTSIEIFPTESVIKPGETTAINVKFNPTDAYSPVTFAVTSGMEYVTIADNVVTGVKNGVATITATTENGLTASCQVSVSDGSIQIADFDISTLYLWEPYQCTLIGADGIDPASVKWTSSNERCVKFFDNGVLMVVGSGDWFDVSITATLPDGQSVSKDVSFYGNNNEFSFEYKGDTYIAHDPFVVSFDKSYVELGADVEVAETVTFEGFTYTIDEVTVYTVSGDKNVALTLPATTKKVTIESNYIDRITCYAVTPPTGTISLWEDQTNIIYVPAESVEAYESTRPWSEYAIQAIGSTPATYYTVTVNATTGGSVTLNGEPVSSLTVKKGDELTIALQPDNGMEVKSASYTMGSSTKSFTNEVTIPSVTADVTVRVTFGKEGSGGDYVEGNAVFDFTAPALLNPAQIVNPENSPVCEIAGVEFKEENITLACYGGTTTARLWAYRDSYQCRIYNGSYITIEALGSTTITGVTVEGSQLDALNVGGVAFEDAASVTYTCPYDLTQLQIDCATNGNHKRADITSITVHYKAEASGIEDITLDLGGEMKVYNLQGIQMGTSIEGLAPGFYIVRQGNKATKISIK